MCTKESGRYKNWRQKAAKYVIYLGSSCLMESCHIGRMLHTMGNGASSHIELTHCCRCVCAQVCIKCILNSVDLALLCACCSSLLVCVYVCASDCAFILHICLCVNDEWLMSLGRLPACSYLAAAGAATLQVIMNKEGALRERQRKKERKRERERERKLGISQW